MKRLTLAVLASLVLAGVAWGASTPLEQRLAEVATVVAGRTADVKCYDEAGWAALAAAEGRNPADIFGAVIPGTNLVELSPRVCTALAAYVAGPPTKSCTQTKIKTVTRRVCDADVWPSCPRGRTLRPIPHRRHGREIRCAPAR